MNANDFGTVENMGMEMEWDAEISKESDFVLLPAGEYDFKVAAFERARYNGGGKMGPCNEAKITLEVKAPDGRTASVRHNLFLNSKCEPMLCAFFRGIGQKKHGEPLKMNWNKVIGSSGRAKFGIREYNGNQFNEVKGFIYPDEAASTQSQGKSFKPGAF